MADIPIESNNEELENDTQNLPTSENEVDNFYYDEDEENEGEQNQEPAEEEYEEIDYNKEKVKIPKSQIKEYLQKGYHSDKVFEQRDSYKNKLEEIEKRTGLTYDKLIAQQEEQQLNQEAEKLIERYNIDEDLALEMARQRKELDDIKSRNAINELNNQNKSEMESWEKKEPAIFNAIKEKVLETMQAHGNINFNVAYQHVKGGMSYEELSSIYNSNNSNSRVNREYDNRRRGGVVTSGEGGGDKDYSSMVKSPFVKRMNEALGLNNSKVGERIAKIRNTRR